ncbi:hypothetical protein UlMin_010419 [Ulmus minor]
MYFEDTEDLPDYEPEEEQFFEDSVYTDPPLTTCSQGHRSTLILNTQEGGSICLLCFSNLISDPLSPTLHVSYALSQLSHALSQPPFLRSLLTFHPLLLVSPLVRALSSFDDDAIARQLLDLIPLLCTSANSSVLEEFVARVSDRLSSGALAWSRRQVFMLHCLGLLLKCEKDNPYAQIREKYGLFSNLVAGLQLPSEEIRGEILFVLYRMSVLHCASVDSDETDILSFLCPKLLRLSLEALVKTQSDDVRLNCVALLTVLAQRGVFGNALAVDTVSMFSSEEDSLMQSVEDETDESPLNILFAEAIKGPLLSTDSQVQIGTVNLLFHYLSSEGTSAKEIQVLVEENIADYVFEILRLSECKDPVVNSCLQVLDHLSKAQQAFKQRLVVGFATLVPVLQYVAQIPFHPVQSQTLKLIWNCISDCPGIPSASHIKELVLILTRMLEKHANGEMGMLPETFAMVCSIFVSLLKSPSSHGTLSLAAPIKQAAQHAVLACLNVSDSNPYQLQYSLFLLKEAYLYSREENSDDCADLRNSIEDLCTVHLVPWLVNSFKEIEEETILGVLEMFSSALLWNSNTQAILFAENIVSSSWFSLSFGFLGLFPTERMKLKVYLILGYLVDAILGSDYGQPIRDAAPNLPSDPIDLLFLLGQKSFHNKELSTSQSAILTILYASSLYDERLADDKLVLASLEQYIISNCSEFQRGTTDLSSVTRLLYLYGLYRGLAKVSYQIPYSPEAERILIQLVNDHEWDLVSARIHPMSLKWLFQQEKFYGLLCDQILKFCRSNISSSSDIIVHNKSSCILNVQSIVELVAAGDNYGARIFVCLLTDVQEHDIIALVELLTTIVNISPAASEELCLQNIGNAIHALYHGMSHTSSSQISTAVLLLIFKIISSVQPETLSDDEIWLALITKLMDCFIITEPADRWRENHLLVIAILCLFFNHCTAETLVEASKTILFSSSLVSVIDSMIHEALLKGPALVDHDEGTSYGEHLLFVLLLNYFSLKSLDAVLPGLVDWQSFFDPLDRTQPLSFIGIPCHDLCRLMYFGSPPVKLVASYTLLELFTRISDQRNRRSEESKCNIEYLVSVITVLEGLVFYGDTRVAVNCGLCLSMILGWEMLDVQETVVIGKQNWSRLIVEELKVSLSVPSIASNRIINHHKPAIYVAIALLKLQSAPGWMRSVFDSPSISGIIKNLTTTNVTSEIVVLFQELLSSGCLETEHIASLTRVLQVCRKRLYTDNRKGDYEDEHIKKGVTISDDLGEIREYLMYLMSSENKNSRGLYLENNSLLEEIELFFTTLTIQEDSLRKENSYKYT